MVKNPPDNAGHIRDVGSISGSGRPSGRVDSNPLQYSCLENPMGRGTWGSVAHGVAQSQTKLKQLTTHTHTIPAYTIIWSIVETYSCVPMSLSKMGEK